MGMRFGSVAAETRFLSQGFALSALVIGLLMSLSVVPAQAQTCVASNGGLTQTCSVPGATASCNSVTNTCTLTCNGNSATSTISFSNLVAAAQSACGGGGGGAAAASSAGGQALVTSGQVAVQSSRVGVTAVQSQITGIRDRIQQKGTASSRPLGFAGEPEAYEPVNPVNSAFAALGYTKAPVYKAPPPPPAPSVTFATWAQGFGDYETRSITSNGIDFGRTTRTYGGIAGIDATIPHIFSASDAYVIGILGGETVSRISNADGSSTRVSGPSVGIYTVYVNGGFSTDSVTKVDFFNLNSVSALGIGTPLGMNVYTSAYNVNYKIQMNTWWVEPTAGVSYTVNVWDSASHAIGMTDGRQWRGQAGVRTGTSFDWNGARVEPTLTGLLYDDFFISGNTIVTAGALPGAPTDEGYIFGQLIGKVNFDWGRGLSSYVEGEVRGREHVFGAAGRVGMRYVFDWAAPAAVVTKY